MDIILWICGVTLSIADFWSREVVEVMVVVVKVVVLVEVGTVVGV